MGGGGGGGEREKTTGLEKQTSVTFQKIFRSLLLGSFVCISVLFFLLFFSGTSHARKHMIRQGSN